MNQKERVLAAIRFENPDRVPLLLLNRDQEEGDILWYDMRIQTGTPGEGDHGGDTSEWGFSWKRLDDGTMGQPAEPVIKDWKDLDSYPFPKLRPEDRLRGLPDFRKRSKNYFSLASTIITGFEMYRCLRGFENSMIDFAERPREAMYLLDRIFRFEKDLMTLAAENGFDGFYFGDDWGTQRDLMISLGMWRGIFKDLYKDQFEHARSLGLSTVFHSCGNVTAIIPDLHEIGVDVMFISQPRVVDLPAIGSLLRGKQCFLSLIDYQEVSLPGTPAQIMAEGRRLRETLGTEHGGFIGQVEDYACMGMSNENYVACRQAFATG